MQIDLCLHDPIAAPQFADDFLTHTGTAIGERFVGLEQNLGIEFVGDRFVQHGFFVEFRLHRQRRRRIARQAGARRDRQRRNRADLAAEQIGVRRRFALCRCGSRTLAFTPLRVAL